MQTMSRAGTARRGGGRGSRAVLCATIAMGCLFGGTSAAQAASLAFASPTASVNETNADVTLNLNVDGTCGLLDLSGATATVVLTSGTATSGTDFGAAAAPASVSINCLLLPSGNSTPVAITIKGDTLSEASETFTAKLVSGGTDVSTSTVTIVDNDPQPTVTVGAAPAVSEGAAGAALNFPVTLSAAAGRAITVHYATADGSATAGSDYTATTGDLSIPAGQTTGTISVPVTADAVDEDDETVGVTISAPVGAALGATETRSATGTITDDDAVTLSVTGASVVEGAAGAQTVTNAIVNLSTTSATAVTVAFKTIDGTALAGSDYLAATGTATIPAGAKTALIPVTILGDAAGEPDEVLGVTISSPSRGTILANGGTAPIIIRNDDAGGGTTPGGGKTGTGVDPNNTGSLGLPDLTNGGKGAIKVSKPVFRKANGTVRYDVRCPTGSGRCKGTLTLFSVPAKKSKVKPLRKEQTLGRKKFDLAAGGTVTITLKLTKAARGWLRTAKTVKTTAYAVATITKTGVSTAKVSGTLKG
jgi:hypothetical protein